VRARERPGELGGNRATGGYKQRAGSSGGKHPKNKLFVGGVPPKKKRHPSAKV
jgi:hypothetical protein